MTKKAPIRQRLARVKKRIEQLARVEQAVDDAGLLLRAAKRKKKWIQKAIKRPGRLHKHFGIPEDKTIPMSKINKEIKRLKAKEKRTKSESSLLRALNMAKTLKKAAAASPEEIMTSNPKFVNALLWEVARFQKKNEGQGMPPFELVKKMAPSPGSETAEYGPSIIKHLIKAGLLGLQKGMLTVTKGGMARASQHARP